MIVGVETSALTPKPTGTSRYIQCLLDQLRSTEHEVRTFSPFVSEAHRNERNHFGSWRRHWYRTVRLAPKMHRSGVDCGIFPNYLMPPAFQKNAAVVIHDLSFLSHPQLYSRKFVWYYTDQLRRSLNQSPVVVTLTEHSRNEIHKRLQVHKDDILLLQAYGLVGANGHGPNPANGVDPYFLYVGHIEPRKNLTRLAAAFESWKTSGGHSMELRLIGDVWIRNREIENLIDRYRHSSSVRFMGFVPDEELTYWYANASGLVHPSLVEGFGLPVLEAMHHGLPILCSANSPMQEVAGTQAISVDPMSVDSIRKGLECLHEMAEETGRVKYEIPYSPGLMREQLIQVLSRLSRKSQIGVGDVFPPAESLDEAVMKTLLYASMFGRGIRRDELRQRVMEVACSERDVLDSLERLRLEHGVLDQDGEILLPMGGPTFSRSPKASPGRRTRRAILRFMRHVPLIHAIAASGASAHDGDLAEDDLDFFIITKPHAAYVVYVIIHAVSLLRRWRTVLCPNYVVDQTALRISHQQDFYTAHQIVSLRPIKNVDGVRHFQNQNRWIAQYFPNFHVDDAGISTRDWPYRVLTPFNRLLMKWYRRIWKSRILKAEPGALQLTPHVIKLHVNDHRPRIKKQFEALWQPFAKRGRERKMTA